MGLWGMEPEIGEPSKPVAPSHAIAVAKKTILGWPVCITNRGLWLGFDGVKLPSNKKKKRKEIFFFLGTLSSHRHFVEDYHALELG